MDHSSNIQILPLCEGERLASAVGESKDQSISTICKTERMVVASSSPMSFHSAAEFLRVSKSVLHG